MDRFENIDPKAAKAIASEDTKKRGLELRAGFLGKIFGSSEHTATHIAGFLAVLLVLVCVVATVFSLGDDKKIAAAVELWKIVLPVVATVLAYIFGASSKD